jgi:hypothetical protein
LDWPHFGKQFALQSQRIPGVLALHGLSEIVEIDVQGVQVARGILRRVRGGDAKRSVRTADDLAGASAWSGAFLSPPIPVRI